MESYYEEWADEGEIICVPDFDYERFELASNTLNDLLFYEVEWISREFIKHFEIKYRELSLSTLDEVSLLMYEASLSFGEKTIYDIYKAAAVECYSIHSNIYLLSKATDYCQHYLYPLKIFFDIRQDVKYFDDFRLLADSLKIIFNSYGDEISDTLVLDSVEKLLQKSKELASNDYEKVLLAFSYLQNGYIEDAKSIMVPTLNSIVNSIKSKDTSYQSIKYLINEVHDAYTLKSKDNDLFTTWSLELTNQLYGAFYDKN